VLSGKIDTIFFAAETIVAQLEAMATKPDDLGHVLDGIAAVRFKDNANSLIPTSIPPELG